MGLRRILKTAMGVGLAMLVIIYAGYKFQDFWRGPTITITHPQSGEQFDRPVVELTGTAKRIAFLSLNGKQIYTDPSGHFEETLLLSPGHNIITVSAEDKFNRETEKKLQLVLSTDDYENILDYGQ
jgi:hypothetical protein